WKRPATPPAAPILTTAGPSSSSSPHRARQRPAGSAGEAEGACRPPWRTGLPTRCTSSPPCSTAWSTTSWPTTPSKDPRPDKRGRALAPSILVLGAGLGACFSSIYDVAPRPRLAAPQAAPEDQH